MKCQSCNADISEYHPKYKLCVLCEDVTLTLSKSDYNLIVLTMGIEHGPEIVERIEAGWIE